MDSGLFDERMKRGELLHDILISTAKKVVGVDHDREGIEDMIKAGYENVYCADLESWENNDHFDIIILGEIIEHVNNCGLFLENIKKYCDKETTIVFTTPNAYYYLFWVYAFFKRESIHPDHNYLFSFSSLSILLSKYGFKVIDNKILWENVDFTRYGDTGVKKLIKLMVGAMFNLFNLTRYLFPQFGKGLIVIAKIVKE